MFKQRINQSRIYIPQPIKEVLKVVEGDQISLEVLAVSGKRIVVLSKFEDPLVRTITIRKKEEKHETP